MSEKASTYLILPEPSEDLIVSEQPWSIETYADGLMDEIFADIDQILDSNDKLPTGTVQQGHSYHLQTITVPQIVLPETQIQTVQATAKVRTNPLSTVVVGTPATSKAVSKPSKQKSSRPLKIMLWMGAGLGIAIASVFWVFNSGLINRLVSKSFQQSLLQQPVQSQIPTKVQIEQDLVNYMLGALSVIDRQEARNKLRSAKPATVAAVGANQTPVAYSSTGTLPTPVAANNVPPTANRSTTIVERIYIPVYQAPQPMRYAPPPMLANFRSLPPVASYPQKHLTRPSKPAPEKIALNKPRSTTKPITVTALAAVRHDAAVRNDIKPVAVQTKPVTVQQASKPLPILSVTSSNIAPPKLPTATAPAPQTQEIVAAVSAPSATAPAPAHTLEGLMELGKRSAALFKIHGVTKQIEVGEAIGNSGWTLVEVANGEAIIRRNGEVRSIYAGQTF